MPLKGTKEQRFEEFGAGKTYARTKRRYGVKRANEQRIAAVLSSLRRDKKRAPTRRREERRRSDRRR